MQQLSDLDLVDKWSEAITIWLNSRQSIRTREKYAGALGNFLRQRIELVSAKAQQQAIAKSLAKCERKPWRVTRMDVLAWISEMHSNRNSEATINLYLSALSSLYKFSQREYMIVVDGQERPLYNELSPVEQIKRPKVQVLGKATYLTDKEVTQLLKTIQFDTSDQGKRNYALILTYLLTGRRNTEIRTLRRGDIRDKDGRVFYRWIEKGGKKEEEELPLLAWNAIQRYLGETKRGVKIKSKDYIFTPLNDNAIRLKRDGQPLIDPKTWNQNRPISMREVGRILKRYGEKAGIDTTRLKVQSLRHTAAHAFKNAGSQIEEISEHLGHTGLDTTYIYTVKTDPKRTNLPFDIVAKRWGLATDAAD